MKLIFLDNNSNESRSLKARFSDGEIIVEEILRNGSVSSIWLSFEEIEKLHQFKLQMTGELK